MTSMFRITFLFCALQYFYNFADISVYFAFNCFNYEFASIVVADNLTDLWNLKANLWLWYARKPSGPIKACNKSTEDSDYMQQRICK